MDTIEVETIAERVVRSALKSVGLQMQMKRIEERINRLEILLERMEHHSHGGVIGDLSEGGADEK